VLVEVNVEDALRVTLPRIPPWWPVYQGPRHD
jgi:hypothetical protein